MSWIPQLAPAFLVVSAISLIVACVQSAIAIALFAAASRSARPGLVGAAVAIGLCALLAAAIDFGAGALGGRPARVVGAALLLLATGYMAWQMGVADDVGNGGRDIIAFRPPPSFAQRWFAASFWGALVAALPVAVTWVGAVMGERFGASAWSAVGVGVCCIMGGWLGRRFADRELIEVLLIIAVTSVAALGEYRIIEAFS